MEPVAARDPSVGSKRSSSVELRGVSYAYGDLQVLADINLDIASGKFFCVVGPSGCGKTTLLRILHGLVMPSAGSVLVGGAPVRGPDRSRAIVFQGASLLPWRKVIDNVGLGLQLSGLSKRQAAICAAPYTDIVGLRGFENYYPHQLSGGMRQRVNLARALALDPELLLMDEPFASLDAQTREVMQGELIRIWEHDRKSVFFITHQIEEAILLGDQVAVMDARPGRIIELLDIDFPRPRTTDIMRSTEFTALVDHIWRRLEASSLREAHHV